MRRSMIAPLGVNTKIILKDKHTVASASGSHWLVWKTEEKSTASREEASGQLLKLD